MLDVNLRGYFEVGKRILNVGIKLSNDILLFFKISIYRLFLSKNEFIRISTRINKCSYLLLSTI